MQTRRAFFTKTLAASAAAAVVGGIPAFAGAHGRIGKFTGKSNHVTTGRAELVVSDERVEVILHDDFSFDGAPDPKVALGANGYDKNTIMGPLKNSRGRQSYVVPSSVDASKYNEVWIWCERFNVPLGVAKLT